MSEAYRRIPSAAINETAERDSLRAGMMLLANASLAEAERKASGEERHRPRLRKAGWSIAIETPQGVAGLWSCWLENQFVLGYPGSCSVPDQVIMDVLGVEPARPVLHVQALPVYDWNYEGADKDPDKPLEMNDAGQILAYREEPEPRLWAKFYGPRLEGDKGRVWVDHSDHGSIRRDFDLVREHALESVSYGGHGRSRIIETYRFGRWSKHAPDAPTTDPGAVQPYRDRFLALACGIAQRMGGASAVHINYGLLVLVPEQLESLGYGNITWLKGRPGRRRGWGDEIVRAEKATVYGTETLRLKSGNEMVPWSTIRRVPCAPGLTAGELLELLTF